MGVALGVLGLAVAATVNLATLVLGGAALAAGLAYDLGLRRTVLSWVPWWGGMAVLPLTAYATAGAIPSRLFVLVPLAALVALGLHFANALPDIEADRAAGVHSLPVGDREDRGGAGRSGGAGAGGGDRLGRRRSRSVRLDSCCWLGPSRCAWVSRSSSPRGRRAHSRSSRWPPRCSRSPGWHRSRSPDPDGRLGTIARRAQVAQW